MKLRHMPMAPTSAMITLFKNVINNDPAWAIKYRSSAHWKQCANDALPLSTCSQVLDSFSCNQDSEKYVDAEPTSLLTRSERVINQIEPHSISVADYLSSRYQSTSVNQPINTFPFKFLRNHQYYWFINV